MPVRTSSITVGYRAAKQQPQRSTISRARAILSLTVEQLQIELGKPWSEAVEAVRGKQVMPASS